MWYIPDDQITKIQNRMSDIRNTPVTEAVNFIAATYELLGTLDTVLFDQRNLERKNKSTMILAEDKKDFNSNKNNNGTYSKVAQALNPTKRTVTIYKNNKKDNKQDSKEDNAQPEKKMNSHERRKERRRLEREAAITKTENTEKKDGDK